MEIFTQETLSKQTNSSSDEKLECFLCGLKSNNLNSHITRVHKISTAEYKNQFPGAQTCRLNQASLEKAKETKSCKITKNKLAILAKEKRAQELLIVEDALKCQLCEFQSASSLISHITRTHKLSAKEYRNRFPGCVLQRQANSSKEKLSLSMKEKYQNDEAYREAVLEGRSFPSEIKHWTRKGHSESEAKRLVSEYQTKAGLAQNDYPELKAQQSERNSGNKNPMSLTSLAERHNVSLKEASNLTPCYGRREDKHPMWGKKHTVEALEKIASAPHLANPDYRSKPERDLESFCATLDRVKHNVRIGRWNVDVLFENQKLIIELFGDYWHVNPQKYDANYVHPLFKKTATELWTRDARKLAELTSLGYEVIVIWEREWKRDRESCEQRIKDAYDRTLRR